MNTYENVIRKQDEVVAVLQDQLLADQKLIDAQARQIQILNERVAQLETEGKALADAGNQMAAANEKLEKICFEQQKLLESFSAILGGK